MICWITSYPRSGNTLTRQILKQCFDIESYTIHPNEVQTEHLFPDQNKYDLNNFEVYSSLKNSEEVFYVKTHYAMFDGQPSICIIRNGRKSISSYARLQKVPVESVIVSQNMDFPSWSSHFWAYYRRPNQLMLRFEGILESPDIAAKKIGEFIETEPKREFINNFKPVNKTMGSGGQEEPDFNDFQEMLFRRCHGVVMSLLSYQ